MKNLKTWWLLVAGVLVFPYILLTWAGSLWLYQQGMLLYWITLVGITTLASYPVIKWLRKRAQDVVIQHIDAATVAEGEPVAVCTPAGRQAWDQVQAIARRVQGEDIPLDSPDRLLAIAREVLETVARQYRPNIQEPILEIPIPDILHTVEQVSRDLRKTVTECVPGSHILTVRNIKRVPRLWNVAQSAYDVYRAVRFLLNPVVALGSELNGAVTNKMLNFSLDEVKQYTVGYCVRRIGFYAIELYSGLRTPDGTTPTSQPSPTSWKEAEQAETAQEKVSEAPLRVLVLGQVKAGKSSLVNALFGQTRAAVDVLPTTRGVTPYLLERDGIPRAVILDTAGYDPASKDSPLAALHDEVLHSDLVLLVSSATSAARAPDRRLMDEVRACFREQPDRMMPPAVVALTHIDLLRPMNQWDPPYDLAHPQGPKAQNIVEAIRAVEEDLALTDDQIVVPVCLKPDRLYNIEEGLSPAIVAAMPEVQRAKYLRCLRESHEADYWPQLWRQALNSGRIALKFGAAWSAGAVKKLVD